MKQKNELDFKILSIIQKGVDRAFVDEEFNKLALDLFHYQYSNNIPYQRFCNQLNSKPHKINHWRSIPFVPTAAFKEAALACFPYKKAKKFFLTSGTTLKKSGRHYLDNLNLYEHSLLTNFKAHFVLGEERWPLLILTCSPEEMPHSSLCHMMGVLQKEIGDEGNPYFIKEGHFMIDRLKKRLKYFESYQKPVILLGTAFSFVHFFDHVMEKKWKVKLAPGSRVMETGGYKAKSRELSKNELYCLTEVILGVPQTHIINEYGMTEMGSQFYDNTLKNFLERNKKPIHKVISPWVRTRVLDPISLEELPPGKTGLLQHYDLANRSSVMGLLTEDMGVQIAHGFEILGRAPIAEVRGCSIGTEEWIK